MKIWTKSENLKIQDGGRVWRHLFDYCCHGIQWGTTWFRLIESTKRSLLHVPSFMSMGWTVSDTPPPPLKASCNYLFFEPSRVNKGKPLLLTFRRLNGRVWGSFRLSVVSLSAPPCWLLDTDSLLCKKTKYSKCYWFAITLNCS